MAVENEVGDFAIRVFVQSLFNKYSLAIIAIPGVHDQETFLLDRQMHCDASRRECSYV